MTEKEIIEPIANLMMDSDSDISTFMTGPDDMFLGMEFKDADGKIVLINFTSPHMINEMFAALGNAMNMGIIRNMNTFSILHKEVGCQRSHEIMAESLEDLVDQKTIINKDDKDDEGPKKPTLTVVH